MCHTRTWLRVGGYVANTLVSTGPQTCVHATVHLHNLGCCNFRSKSDIYSVNLEEKFPATPTLPAEMSPTYTLHEVTTRVESDAIVDLAWHAYHEPYLPSFQVYHPVFGPTAQDHEAAVLADKERAWRTHLAYKEGISHWIYVNDEQSGAVIGACQVYLLLLRIMAFLLVMLRTTHISSGSCLPKFHGRTSFRRSKQLGGPREKEGSLRVSF
jgi:hypothetical protein